MKNLYLITTACLLMFFSCKKEVTKTVATTPATPIGLTATVLAGAKIQLAWTANTENDLSGYKLYADTNANAATLLATVLNGSITYTDNGLKNGTVYYYRVSAFNSSGLEGAKSNFVSAKADSSSEKIIEIKTSFGNMYMWLNKECPKHRANFLALADTNYFDNTTFHRIVPGFVIQGGDPNSKDADTTNDGTGGPPWTIPAEIDVSKFKHVYGAVGAARTADNVNPLRASNGSQFYIVIPTAGTPSLDGKYTVFGKIIKGMDVANIIVAQPNNPSNNRPYTDIKMDVNVLEKTLQQLKDEYNFVP